MKKARTRGTAARRQRNPARMYIIGGIAALSVVVLVISVAALARGGSGDGFNDTILVPTPRPSDVAQSGHVFGSADAPVTITEYLDFQCPFCRRAATDIMPTIEQQFIATGKAKLEVHAIAILGSESVQAAAAAECANDRGMFWGYHDMLYANQGAEQGGSFSPSRLKRFASLLNMDSNAFDSCLDSSKYVDQVQQNTTAAHTAGVGSTPTFKVNGTTVSTTIDALSAAIGQATGE